jgi:hypothetical protein
VLMFRKTEVKMKIDDHGTITERMPSPLRKPSNAALISSSG